MLRYSPSYAEKTIISIKQQKGSQMKKNMKHIVGVAACAFALASMSSLYAEVQEKLKPAHKNFLAADADKSGGLNVKEFKVFIDANAAITFGRAKEIKKRNAYDRVFSKVDKDNNGSITWAEIESMQ